MFSFNKVCSSVIPTGNYKVQLTDIKFKTSSTGTQTFDMECHYTIVDGPMASRTLIDTIYEKAFSFRLKPFLRAVGVDMNREFTTAKELYEYGVKEAKGKTLIVGVGIHTYNGNDYNNIKDFTPLPSSTASLDDVVSEFGTAPAVQPEKPRLTDIADVPTLDVTSSTDAPTVDSDDIPF